MLKYWFYFEILSINESDDTSFKKTFQWNVLILFRGLSKCPVTGGAKGCRLMQMITLVSV